MAQPMSRNLEEILSEKQVHRILNEAAEPGWQLAGYEMKPATQGLSGFLGDHFRLTLHVRHNGFTKKIRLFVKGVPMKNNPKADFINENNYFRREALLLKLCEEMQGAEGPNPWGVKAYVHNEKIIVMPDLTFEGYSHRSALEYLDMDHVLVCIESVARFHAAFANYETKKILQSDHTYSFSDEQGNLLDEPTLLESPWLQAAAKLTTNFLAAFSNKYYQYPTNLESKLYKIFVQACESLAEYKGTLNVILHKDLWVNNILFKYQNGVPTNAILIDYQCVRYGPPAVDLMLVLYLTTSRSFRERYERDIELHYYSMFCKCVDDSTSERLYDLNYDCDNFLTWCETARLFAMLETIGIFPYVLMDPVMAQKSFDDPETFMKHCNEDRTAPVLAHARESVVYRERQLEVCEEFIERYLLKQL